MGRKGEGAGKVIKGGLRRWEYACDGEGGPVGSLGEDGGSGNGGEVSGGLEEVVMVGSGGHKGPSWIDTHDWLRWRRGGALRWVWVGGREAYNDEWRPGDDDDERREVRRDVRRRL